MNIMQSHRAVAAVFILALMLIGSYPSTASAAIARVQAASGSTGASAAGSITVTLPRTPTKGNTLIAVIGTRGTADNTVTSISQGGTITWTRATQRRNGANGVTLEVWYAYNIGNSAPSTLTVTLSGNWMASAVVAEYNGALVASTPLDAISPTPTTTAAAAAATPSVTATAATTQNAELVVGGLAVAGNATTPYLSAITNGFSSVGMVKTSNFTPGNDVLTYMLDKTVTATGTQTFSGTLAATVFSAGALATFKEAIYAGPVTVTPRANGYTSAAPTVTTYFTAPETLTACQYTTNNGTTWTAATLTLGNKCSVTLSGLTGSLAGVNMQAQSANIPYASGRGTAVPLTVDTTAATDGTLTVTPGNPSNGLLWTAATDVSGIDHYDLYFQAGATAPACGAGGTLLYTGKWLNYTHTGLAASTQYSYRLCATNGVGLVSTGATATVTTVARPSVANTCASCHGLPPVDNATRDASTARFPGSHTEHTGTYKFDCTNCHTNNTSFEHQRGVINMAFTAGSYSRGAAPTQANSFTPGTCSNTYCHSDGTSVSTTVIPANTSPTWGGTTTCSTCHDFPPVYQNASPKYNSHSSVYGHRFVSGTTNARTCDACHSSVTYNAGAYTTDPTLHNSGSYNVKDTLGYTFVANSTGGSTCSTPTSGCHANIPATWGSRLGCVGCHDRVITRTQGRPNKTLANVVAEFGLDWGHKNNKRAPVTDADCIVCHLEGNYSTQKPSIYHANGTIDLRDPDIEGETRITNLSGTSFAFSRFSTSFGTATRYTDGHQAARSDNDIAYVISVKFCMKCHDSLGAQNTTARAFGVTNSATMPWGGSTGYAAGNGVPVANGLVDVASQFATTNSSVHPILGPRVKGFPTPARYNPPYNNFTRAGGTTAASATKTAGVVMNCFDCHNVVGTPSTLRTNSAHGNAATVRGVYTISGTPAAGTNEATLCKVCHKGYDTNTGANHGAAPDTAATNLSRSEKVPFLRYGCNVCHSSGYNTPAVRPVRALDIHGVNALPATGQTLSGNWSATGKPYAFIRNRSFLGNHSPALVNGVAPTNASTCNMLGSDGNGVCGNQGSKTYSLGGSY